MINLSKKFITIGLSLISPLPLFISAKILFVVLFRVNIFENYSPILISIILIGIWAIDFFIFKMTPIWEEMRHNPNIVLYFVCVFIYVVLDLIITIHDDNMITHSDDFINFDIMVSLYNLIFIIVVFASYTPQKQPIL